MNTLTTVVVKPGRGFRVARLAEVWEYRELLFFLVWRDVKVRYTQTLLGASWALLQPVLAMLVFTLFFGRLAGIPSDGVPYPLFVYTALVPWQFCASAVTQGGNSLVANQNLITKVYFPRLLVPLATVLAGLVDTAIAGMLLLGMMAYYGIVPTVAVAALPVSIGLAVGTALGASLWLSALNVRYRDVRYTLPFITQLWLFVSPVVYGTSLVPEHWRVVLGLNPMSSVTDGFRWALLGVSPGPVSMFAVSSAVMLGLLGSGLLYFARVERTFADVV
jgi:homopolymeric O-antigen transport system permease protein